MSRLFLGIRPGKLWRNLKPGPGYGSKISHMRLQRNIFPSIGVIFVHIPKTAGTSLHSYFSELSEAHASAPRLPELRPYASEIKYKHKTASELKAWIGEDLWNRAFKVAFVRNPWDLMVSSYTWWLQKAPSYPHFSAQVAQVQALGSFKNFLASDFGSHMINEVTGSMEDWFQDSGRDIVDYVGKVETIDADLRAIRDVAGLADGGILLEQLNPTKREGYRSYYDDESRETIHRRFTYIIDRFGYTF